MNEPFGLGIDTSAYTTSLAAVGESGVLYDARQVLPVPSGRRGLRPSDALFYHVRDLPEMLERLYLALPPQSLVQVAVSVAPRPTPDSYLPPFLAGQGAGRMLAASRNVPLLLVSHQEGHMRAGLAGAGFTPQGPFLALHISGGTTELVYVEHEPPRFRVELLGGSDDLYAGQFVDRVGVLLGSAFPAGKEMDHWAEAAQEMISLPVSRPRLIHGQWWISFSGPESAAERVLQRGAPAGPLARGVMESIATTLSALVLAQSSLKSGDLLVVGGVAANTHLRRRLAQLLAPQFTLRFAPPQWSRDNAIGVAYMGWDACREKVGSDI